MIPLSLRLHNFMSYGEDTPPLDFSRFTTACLTGDNGHGKSTLLDAITWALWGETRAKNLDDVVRLGQDEAEVEFIFDLENERYRVLRKRSLKTRQSALELQGFDQATQRYRPLSGANIRETEAKIVQLLHMNYDTFINSVFVLQGRADEFTTRRPGERKRILADILGLSIYDALEVRARARRNEMDLEVKTLHQRLDELQQEVAQKEELATAVSAHQNALAHLQVELQSALQRQQEFEQKIQISETFLQNAPSIAAAYSALQEARQRDATMAQTLQERYKMEQEKSQVEFRMQQKRHALELEQRSLLDRQRDWQLKEATLPTLQRQVEDIQQQLTEVEQQTKRLEQIRTDGVAIRVQLETSIPQAQETLQKAIQEQGEKRALLAS